MLFYFLFTALDWQQLGLGHYGAQQVRTLSALALGTFLLLPSGGGLRLGRCQILFAVTKEGRR